MTSWFLSHIVLIQATLTTILLALSVQIPMRAGAFSFAGIGAFGIGGYGAAIAIVHMGWPTYAAIGLGVVVAAILVFILGIIVQRLSGLYLGMATLAFTMIVAVVAVNGGALTGGASGLFGAVSSLDVMQIFIMVVIVLAVVAFFETGARGRRTDAVREDPSLAAAMGISVARQRRYAFLASGAVGGLAGALTTLMRTSITPAEVNFHLIVLALTVIVVGGQGSWIGVVIGSAVFVWLPTWLQFVSEWEDVIYGVLIVIAAVFLPNGLFGIVKSVIRRAKLRSRGEPDEVMTSALPAIQADRNPKSPEQVKEGSSS